MKKFLFIFILSIFILTFTSFGDVEKTSTVEIMEKNEISEFSIDNKIVKFDKKPYLKDRVIMVPMKEFFNSLGCNVEWINETKEVIAYKNNMFAKLQINSNIAYKNGKKFILTSPPVINNEKTYVPADFIAETFDMNISYEEENNSVNIESESNDNKYLIVNNSFFKKINLPDLGINFSIPSFWSELDLNNHLYGYKDEFQSYSIKVLKTKLTENTSLEAFVENNKKELFKAFGDKIIFSGNDIIKTDNFDISVSFITIAAQDLLENQILYFAIAENNGYIFTCSYENFAFEEDAIDLFNNIISTFQINKLTLDSKEEHYFENKSFFDYKILLNNEIYSNMSVQSSINLNFSSIINHNLIDMKAVVSKGNETLEFPISIKENNFEGKIYLPFGLGKHNIEIVGITSENVSLDIMKFSLINISNEKIRYLIPSKFINSNSEKIYNQANMITYKSNSDYLKSKEIYNWIVENIILEKENDLLKPSLDTLNSKIGNEKNISILYCTLLRSLEIPSRIVEGNIENASTIWTEIFLNGKWIISNPYWAIKYNDDIFESDVKLDYFNIYSPSHYSSFESTKILPY